MRVGIVGAGDIGTERHLPAYRNADGVTLSGVYDRNPERVRSVVDEEGVRGAESVGALCEVSDVIAVCTPPWTHHDVAVDALERGCHVFTEKPLAMTTAEADRMIETADAESRHLAVVNNFLYLPAVRKAKRLVGGSLGPVTRTHAVQLRQFEHDSHDPSWFERLPGGMFWDESPHMLYLTRAFLGEFDVADASAEPRAGPKQKHNVRATFDGPGGATGALTMDFDSPMTEWWFVVFCAGGAVLVDLFRDVCLWFRRESNHAAPRVLRVVLRAVRQASFGTALSGLRLLYERFVEGYEVPSAGLGRQVAAVTDRLRRGGAPPVGARVGRRDLARMERIADAAGLS